MKILIADDHPMVRKGLVSALSFEENVEEINEAANVKEAVAWITQNEPEIAMIDLRLGAEDGLEIVQKVRKQGVKTKFIVLTSSMKKDDFLRSRDAGIDGYILKDAFPEDIVYAFHTVSRGKKFYHPEFTQYEGRQEQKSELDQLTQREKDVLRELGKGFSNIEIAEKLFISEHTVKKHVSNILLKLNLAHRTQAALLSRDAR